MLDIFAIMAGGAIGALLRYGVSTFVHSYVSKSFAWGTLTANLIGAVLIGFLWELFEHVQIENHVRMFIFVGFLGGFTTFSSYALESFQHFENEGSKVALLYVALSNILGIVCVFCAVFVARYVVNFFHHR
jgi:CrcB protein